MTIEEIEKQIKLVESLDTSIVTIEEIKLLIDPVLKSVFFTTPLIDQSTSLYRSVKFGNSKVENYNQIIYPPKSIVQNYQRLNEPFKPVFYCSSSINCCVLEGRYKVGDFLNISEWEVKPDNKLLTSNVGYTSFLNEWSKREVPKWHKNSKVFEHKAIEEIESNYLVLDFISRLFCKNFDTDSTKYKITIAIANILGFDSESSEIFKLIGEGLLSGEKAMEAIVYPSILSNANYDNFAIRRYSFHNKVDFVSTEYVKILSLTDENIEFEILDFSNEIDENNKFIWKGRAGQYTLTENNVGVHIKRTSDTMYQISRTDGKKMYKN